MSISDRIAIMNHGKLVQIGEVEEVYRFPRTEFVARFIGNSNLIRRQEESSAEMSLWEAAQKKLDYNGSDTGGNISDILAVRSEDIKLGNKEGYLKGRIIGKSYHGSTIDY